MPDANIQPEIDALTAANAAVEAKLQATAAELQAAQAKQTVDQQQITDLRAAIANTANLGK